MDARQREYDRFGPWVLEISDDDPVPPLFASSITRTDPTILRIKIPRDVDRRATTPGADLYDYVICLHAEDLVVYQRVGREVHTQTCRYRDVQHLRVDHDVLLGNVHLGLPGRSFDLPYSTVSDDLMGRLVELVRARYVAAEGATPACTELTVREGELSFHFDRLLGRERTAGTGMRLIAAQATVPVGAAAMTLSRRLAARLAGQRLLEAIHLTDGRELKIIGHGRAYASWWQGHYGDDMTYIPLANIVAAEWRDDSQHGAIELVLRTTGGESVHVFAGDNASIPSYAAFLAALAPDTARDARAA